MWNDVAEIAYTLVLFNKDGDFIDTEGLFCNTKDLIATKRQIVADQKAEDKEVTFLEGILGHKI